jgi:hypothetical protein
LITKKICKQAHYEYEREFPKSRVENRMENESRANSASTFNLFVFEIAYIDISIYI